MSTHFTSYRSWRLVLPLGVFAAVCVPAQAQTIAGASPLQQGEFNAVFNMCAKFLDGHADTFTGPAVFDLHDQCHAIAVAALTEGNATTSMASALGALQQVSGNQVTTQGALASRVSAGQFANISGRLTALRFGSSSAISQGSLASNGSSPAGPQTFYLDGNTLDRSAANTSSQPAASAFAPVSQGSFVNTAFLTDDAVHLVSDAGAGGGSTGSTGAPQVTSPWGTFVQGSYTSGHHDVTASEDPFDFHSASITAGLDYNFGPGVVGVSLGYDDYDAGFRTSGLNVSGGGARVEGTSASVYGAWFSDTWTFNGIASYGRLHTDLTRQVSYNLTYALPDPDLQTDIHDTCTATACTATVNRTLHGDPSGSSAAIGATAGYQYAAAGFDLLPQLSVAYRRATIDAFDERDDADPDDGLPLAFNDQTIESLRSVLGLDVSHPLSAPFGVVTPLLHVEWDHEFHTSTPAIEAHYVYDPSLKQGLCASCYYLPSDKPPGNYGVAGLGLSATLAHRVQAYLYDEVLVGYTDYHANTVSLGLRAQF